MKPFGRSLTAIAIGSVSITLWAQSQPPTDWIREHAIRLTTVEAGHGFADMQPLKAVIGDARIVSLSSS